MTKNDSNILAHTTVNKQALNKQALNKQSANNTSNSNANITTHATLAPVINFIWSIADTCLRSNYKAKNYSDVILPLVVIRRMDTMLEPTKSVVLKVFNEEKNSSKNFLDAKLKKATKLEFYNTSAFTFASLLDDPENIRANFELYIDGFSDNVKDIIKNFDFAHQIKRLDKAGILYETLQMFCAKDIDLSPKALSNHDMGLVYEELIRRFSEESVEEAGEHFTPREIIALMCELVFLPLKDSLHEGVFDIYDNACGSGGMLTEAKAYLENTLHSKATINLFGQEINPESYATCKADMLIKGEDIENIKLGSTLSNDGFSGAHFDFMLTNPPYGLVWGNEQKKLGVNEKDKSCSDPRFFAITGKDDAQMMFLLNMIAKMRPLDPNSKSPIKGSYCASVHSGTALFNSDSGMSKIRGYLLENDLLQAIIALPDKMFYKTSIQTFILFFTNNKKEEHKGKVALIDASSFYTKMKKSLSKKANKIEQDDIKKIVSIYMDYKDSAHCKILPNSEFCYKKVTSFAPLTPNEFSAYVEEQKEKQTKKTGGKNTKSPAKPFAFPHEEAVLKRLEAIESEKPKFLDFAEFKAFINTDGIKLKDSDLLKLLAKDSEKIAASVETQAYFDTEVRPFSPSAFPDTAEVRGYEILFNKYFYEVSAGKGVNELKAELFGLAREEAELLKRVLA